MSEGYVGGKVRIRGFFFYEYWEGKKCLVYQKHGKKRGKNDFLKKFDKYNVLGNLLQEREDGRAEGTRKRISDTYKKSIGGYTY